MIRLMRGMTLGTLGVTALILAGCGAEAPPLAESEPPVVTVSQPIEKKEVIDYDQYTGRIEAAETVEVRARVRGELIKIHFKDGAFVKAAEPPRRERLIAQAVATQGVVWPGAGPPVVPQAAVPLVLLCQLGESLGAKGPSNLV
jgi:hypothetical protein